MAMLNDLSIDHGAFLNLGFRGYKKARKSERRSCGQEAGCIKKRVGEFIDRKAITELASKGIIPGTAKITGCLDKNGISARLYGREHLASPRRYMVSKGRHRRGGRDQQRPLCQ